MASSSSSLHSKHNNKKMIMMMMGMMMMVCCVSGGKRKLRFNGGNGEFKILQVADMHYANGATTPCLDVVQGRSCSDKNTTAFLRRLIAAEKPDLVVFTGDNIFGADAKNSAWSQAAAFSPAMSARVPFAAVLGNHDQEGTLNRSELVKQIASLPFSQTMVNPPGLTHPIDGFGNFHVSVSGPSVNQSSPLFNLYFFDSGDYARADAVSLYDWVKPSQLLWFRDLSRSLNPDPNQDPKPALTFFHIPLKEFNEVDNRTRVGAFQELGVSSADVNSGLFATMAEAGDVKGVFVGHDHLNDFCGKVGGMSLCYGGGFGYHAYGREGWDRRARVVVASLKRLEKEGGWGDVEVIRTWKRLDDAGLSTIDVQTLWHRGSP